MVSRYLGGYRGYIGGGFIGLTATEPRGYRSAQEAEVQPLPERDPEGGRVYTKARGNEDPSYS